MTTTTVAEEFGLRVVVVWGPGEDELGARALQRAALTARRARIQYRIRLCRALGGEWTPEERACDAPLHEERTES